MDTSLLTRKDPIQPSEEDVRLATETARQLAAHAKNGALKIRIMEHGHEGATLELPAAAVGLLVDLLSEMSRGNAVTLIPYHAELTTQQAADLLNVSRPFVVELCDKGELPYFRLGTHRKIRFTDLMAFKRKSLRESREVLDELAALHQEMGGYEKP